MVALGIGGFVAATGLTLGALALAGDATGSIVQPHLSPSRGPESVSRSPSPDDGATDPPSPSVDDHGGGSGSDDPASDDHSGSGSSGSGSSGSGSGSDNSGPGSESSGSGSSGSGGSGSGSSGSDADDD